MAQYTLLITAQEIKQFTPSKGALDKDYLEPAILTAQDLSLAYILGYNLTERLKDLKEAGTIETTPPYDFLYSQYVRPYLRHQAFVDALEGYYLDYNNQGILQKQSQQGTPIDSTTFNTAKSSAIRKADGYKTLLIDHLCRYGQDYPEYFTDQKGNQQRTDDGQVFGIENF